MSYARFGWDGSDVYVFVHSGGFIECCGCFLDDSDIEEYYHYVSFQASTTQEMVDHLKSHESAGHTVPPKVYDRLWEEHEENMEYIRKGGHNESK